MTHAAGSLILAFTLGNLHLLSDPASAQSTGSPIDVQREQAAALFGPRLAALSAIQLQAAADQRRYEVGCKGKTTTITPKTMTAVVAVALAAIDEDARRRSVLPGIMRDLKASYGLPQ